jgi:4'-phosphopantetheinyl transferase
MLDAKHPIISACLTHDTAHEAALKSPDTPAFQLSTLDAPRAREAGVRLLRVDFEFGAALDSPSFAALSDEEHASAGRFLRREDALRHAATRAALRDVLAQRMGVRPDQLHFERDASGRPRLTGEPRLRGGVVPDFNVSHAGHHALIAVSERRRVGVDIEQRRPEFDWRPLAAAVFAPDDAAHVASLPEHLRRDAFYGVWTAKEALLKALGTGIADGLTGFSVLGGRNGEPAIRLAGDAPHSAGGAPRAAGVAAFDAAWCTAPPGYAACVAWSRDESAVAS